MNPALFILLVVVFLVALAWYSWYKNKRRAEEAVLVAAARGYTVEVDSQPRPSNAFDVLRSGDGGRHATYTFQRAGSSDRVFQFNYYTKSRNSDGGTTKTWHEVMCAMVRLPFLAPSTKITKENFASRLARSLGKRDIEVESAEFNKAYKVTGDDERFAVALLDPATINHFIQAHRVDTDMNLEFHREWLLVYRSGEFDPDEMLDFFEWAQGIPPFLPTVLESLYPPPPDPTFGRPGPPLR